MSLQARNAGRDIPLTFQTACNHRIHFRKPYVLGHVFADCRGLPG